jgi:hypothetical protein
MDRRQEAACREDRVKPRPNWRRRRRRRPKLSSKQRPRRKRSENPRGGGKADEKPPAPPSTEPDAKAQKNFTDPESRIMKMAASRSSYRRTPATARRLISRRWRNRNIDAYVATGRAMDAVAGAVKGEAAAAPALEPANVPTRVEATRAKIKAGGHASPYRLRKQLPEPVCGQIKQARGFRQFLLRGFEKVRAEWAVVCTARNLLNLAHRRRPSAALSMAPGAA